MTEPITETQEKVLAFVAEFTARERWAPTRKEISNHFGWRSINSADTHIKALIRKGRLQIRVGGWHAHRNIQIVTEG